MIVEFLLNCLFGIADGFFAMLPEISWSVDTTAWEYAGDILDMIAYLLPMDTITAIIVLIVDIALFRVVISFIRAFGILSRSCKEVVCFLEVWSLHGPL